MLPPNLGFFKKIQIIFIPDNVNFNSSNTRFPSKKDLA